jgi:glucose-1-phosphate cytidylyltransferase
MKAVILAGGRGTRIAEESTVRPKPMITIGGRPILWHIMEAYSEYGITDFIICLGYKGYVIKEYFANYFLHAASSVEFDLANRTTKYGHAETKSWNVVLVETGEQTQTGGRIKRIEPWVRGEEAFCLTYGDGLSDVDISALVAHHRQHRKYATITAVTPPGRFGALQIANGEVKEFVEKPPAGGQMVNGGYFVLSPKVIDYIEDDSTNWEYETLPRLAMQRQLSAFPHAGFWQPMDTIREQELLEELWKSGRPPWRKGIS